MNKTIKGLTLAIASAGAVVWLGFWGQPAKGLTDSLINQKPGTLAQASTPVSGKGIQLTAAGLTLKRIHQQAILSFYTHLQEDVTIANGAPISAEDKGAGADQLQGKFYSFLALQQSQGLTADSKLDLTGLGPIRIGMTVAEAEEVSGVTLVSSTRQDKSCRYYEPEDGPGGISFMAVDDRIIRIDVWSESDVNTLSGARIGSTEADLNALYPGQIEVTPNPFTQGKYLTYVPEAGSGDALYRLVFETNSRGKVTQFRTGQFPAVTWPKGCA